MHAPADAARGFVDRRADAVVLKRQRCIEAGDAAAHYRDLGAGPDHLSERAAKGKRARGRAGRLEEVAACQAKALALLLHRRHGLAGPLRFVEVLEQLLEPAQ